MTIYKTYQVLLSLKFAHHWFTVKWGKSTTEPTSSPLHTNFTLINYTGVTIDLLSLFHVTRYEREYPYTLHAPWIKSNLMLVLLKFTFLREAGILVISIKASKSCIFWTLKFIVIYCKLNCSRYSRFTGFNSFSTQNVMIDNINIIIFNIIVTDQWIHKCFSSFHKHYTVTSWSWSCSDHSTNHTGINAYLTWWILAGVARKFSLCTSRLLEPPICNS